MKKTYSKVSVGGLPITPLQGIDDALNLIFDQDIVKPGFAVAMNAEKVMACQKDNTLLGLLSTATLLYADGISVVQTIRKKGIANHRIPGCELWESLMKRSAQSDKVVYLLGATEATNRATAEKLQVKYQLKNICRRNGYFDNFPEVIEDILVLKPDIITVAMGSPRQEELIANLIKHYPSAFYMGVGGSYDVFTGNVKRAPKIFRTYYLEWFYRLCSEPKRIFRQVTLLEYLYWHFSNRL